MARTPITKSFDVEDFAFGVFLLTWLVLAVSGTDKAFGTAGLVGIATYVVTTIVLLIVRRNEPKDQE